VHCPLVHLSEPNVLLVHFSSAFLMRYIAHWPLLNSAVLLVHQMFRVSFSNSLTRPGPIHPIGPPPLCHHRQRQQPHWHLQPHPLHPLPCPQARRRPHQNALLKCRDSNRHWHQLHSFPLGRGQWTVGHGEGRGKIGGGPESRTYDPSDGEGGEAGEGEADGRRDL
jgi:hypothetical protein